jgi:hypothetical protein
MRTLICATALALVVGTALADEPLQLTEDQMDSVTAGGVHGVVVARPDGTLEIPHADVSPGPASTVTGVGVGIFGPELPTQPGETTVNTPGVERTVEHNGEAGHITVVSP